MPVDPVQLKRLIEAEVATVRDRRIVEQIQCLLVEPSLTMRGWDYGNEDQEYPCWTVLSDAGHCIVFCEHGFGPRTPWGLIEDKADRPATMGMDTGWFSNFLDAFFESGAASSLPIWQVFQIDTDEWVLGKSVTEELSWDAARRRCEALRAENPALNYVVHQPQNP